MGTESASGEIISPEALRALILGEAEFALIDVREQGAFSAAHLLFAACVPYSRMELLLADLVPRITTRIVVVGAARDAGLVERACRRLSELGYSDVVRLAGGIEGWRSAGLEVFSGVNVPSKAFGEFVEHTYHTPRLSATEVKALLDQGENLVIVDSRPFEEYRRMSIPTATDVPGAELVYRIHDIAPDPDTLVVVNCAGRTRSIIGAQSLVNAGIPNAVAALKDGTMGWHLAGLALERGATRLAAAPTRDGLEKALAAAARVAERFAIETVSAEQVERWRDDPERTTYLLDVRSPSEYAEGHLPGYRNAPGGQLVQATDEYVAVRNATLVLADDVGVRATMTASWLVQMGWPKVYVLAEGISNRSLRTGSEESAVLGELPDATMTTAALAKALDRPDNGPKVIDIGPSTAYERQHIPGALWCVRARLAEALQLVPEDVPAVLTSTDGLLARLALKDSRALGRHAQALEGGTARWLAEGREVEGGLAGAVGERDDVWYKPYEHRGAQEQFMRDYLNWEVALVEQIARDGTTRFRKY